MNDVFLRFMEAAQCNTQEELANFLGIRQALISDAKRRNELPSAWLEILKEKQGINPEWVLKGKGSKRITEIH